MASLVACAVAATHAQAPDDTAIRVEAIVEPAGTVTDTQPVQLSVRISGERLPDWKAPDLPVLENLRVVNGPFVSRSFRSINFRQTSQVVALTYVLLAEGPGPAEIPAIEVEVGDERYRTEPIRLEVRRGPTGPAPLGGTAQGGGAAPDATGAAEESRGEIEVYLRAKVTRPDPWVGQTIGYQLELMVDAAALDRYEIGGMQWLDPPTFSNFWVEDDPAIDAEGESYSETVGGRRMQVFPLVRKVLIPTRAGSFTLAPAAMRFGVATRDRLFRGLLSRSTPVVRRSAPVTVEVRALPVEGRPEGFSGAVGSFRLDSTLDRDTFAVDEAIAMRVTVEGSGFLKSVAPPPLPSTPQLRVFEPEVEETSTIADGSLRARKTWEWIVVPLSGGEVELPGSAFSYFDPDSGRYETLLAAPRTVTVSGTGGGSRGGGAGPLRAERDDIRYIKTSVGALRERIAPVHARTWFRVAAIAPIALVPLLVWAGRRRERLRANRGLVRRRKAAAVARKRWARLRREADGLDAGAFHERLARVLVDYVADRFDRSASGLTYDLAETLLAREGVPDALRARFREVLETCDFARFVPASGEADRREETLRRVRELVDGLEEALP